MASKKAAKPQGKAKGIERSPHGEGYERIDQYDQELVKRISDHYTDILSAVGEDPKREGLLKTPERVAKALQYLTHGYDLDPANILKSAMFTLHLPGCSLKSDASSRVMSSFTRSASMRRLTVLAGARPLSCAP